MKRKNITAVCVLLLSGLLWQGCSGKTDAPAEGASAAPAAEAEAEEAPADTAQESEPETAEAETDKAEETQDAQAELPDGVYTARFETDSSMFRVSEACDGKGTLTVEDGQMTIHISLNSKKIVNLYPGLSEDAAKEDAELLQPTTDTVTYSDGLTEEVYGFDVPVPALEEEFDLALIGTKEKWYDHKVKVSDPEPLAGETGEETENAGIEDGSYQVELSMEGGSGRAQITSPAELTAADGEMTARIEWSSPNYDYMIVAGEKYMPVNTDGNSVFEIPVAALDEPIEVIGDTVAMSTPHEVEYTITFHADTLQPAE